MNVPLFFLVISNVFIIVPPLQRYIAQCQDIFVPLAFSAGLENVMKKIIVVL